MKKEKPDQIVIYRSKDGKAQFEVKIGDETIWLDTSQIAALFAVNRPAIVKHIQNIYKTGELRKSSTCSILEQVALDGKKEK